MSQAKGMRARLLLDFEDSYGVSPAVKSGRVIKFNSESLSASQEAEEPATITGRRDSVEPILGNIDVSGSLTLPAELISMGLVMKGLFGAPETAADGSLYRHVFKTSAEPPSMVIEKGLTDIGAYFLYNGCKVSGFEMTVGGSGELTASVSIIGGKRTLNTESYDDAPVNLPFVRLQNFKASIHEGGVLIGNVSSFSVNINPNLENDKYAIGGDGFRTELPEGLLSVSGSISTFFRDVSLLEKAVNSATTSLKLSFDAGVKGSFELLFPEVRLEQKDPEVSGPGGIMATFNWKAHYEASAEGSSVVATLINEIEEY